MPFSGEDSSLGEQCLSAENIQRYVLRIGNKNTKKNSNHNFPRLVDQQISPSYNGHKVTIKVNRSNETISTSTSAKAKVWIEINKPLSVKADHQFDNVKMLIVKM